MSNIIGHYDHARFSQAQNSEIERALVIAQKAHEGQLRASGEPYIIHPVAVAEIVAEWGLDGEAMTAALLHDVVEDTQTPLGWIREQFGATVADLVDGLTKMRLSASPRPSPDSLKF